MGALTAQVELALERAIHIFELLDEGRKNLGVRWGGIAHG